jgi:hypothetical protein
MKERQPIDLGTESERVDRLLASLLDEMRRQDVPPKLKALAEQLQAAIDRKRASEKGDAG